MNSLDSNRELAENKLILLYIIEKINMPISNLQITKLVLENKFMNYFLLQQYLNELCSSSFLTQIFEDTKTLYTISDSGRETLDCLVTLMPEGIKKRINITINSIRKKIKSETLVTADFLPESENEFVVSCKIHEDNFSLIDLKITVGTKNDARTICKNWEKYSHRIYPEIVDTLTKKR